MKKRTRPAILFYLALVTIGLILISASLPELQFKQGIPIPGAEPSPAITEGETESATSSVDADSVWQTPLALAFVVILVILIFSLVKKVNVKKSLGLAGGLLGIVLAAILLNQIKFTSQPGAQPTSVDLTVSPSLSYNSAPIGEPPEQLFTVITILLSLGIVLLVLWLSYQTIRRTQKRDPIAIEAAAALKAIEAGDSLSNVVLRCYMQMERVASEEQGIEREGSATPREFQTLLAAKGIPLSSIHQLTFLFERVRYGAKELDLDDERVAVECLSEIRLACESIGRKSK